MIDAGRMPGPKMHITVGYLEGKGSFAPQMPELIRPKTRAGSWTTGPAWER